MCRRRPHKSKPPIRLMQSTGANGKSIGFYRRTHSKVPVDRENLKRCEVSSIVRRGRIVSTIGGLDNPEWRARYGKKGSRSHRSISLRRRGWDMVYLSSAST